MANEKLAPFKDLATIVWLRYKKHDVEKITENDGKKYFYFRDTPELNQDLTNYIEDKPVTVVPRFLLSEYRATKSLLHRDRIVIAID